MKNTKVERLARLLNQLQELGFTYQEGCQLRRIEMTLHWWDELECGDEHGRCIERDEVTGKPFMTYYPGQFLKRARYPIADREKGALKRLGKIIAARNARLTPSVLAYHQGDCRGVALYIVKETDIHEGETIDSVYDRGICVEA